VLLCWFTPAVLASPAVSVGIICTAIDSGIPPCAYFVVLRPVSEATSVGHNPASVPLVRRAGVMRSHNSPPHIIPHFGKVTEDHGKSSGNKQRAVFHEDVARLYFTDDSRHVGPQAAALSGDADASAGAADVLARESPRHHVNTASPRASVKSPHFVPYRERRENAVILPGAQYSDGVGVVFDGADGSPSEDVAAEYAATSACEKCQLIHSPCSVAQSLASSFARSASACAWPSRQSQHKTPISVSLTSSVRAPQRSQTGPV